MAVHSRKLRHLQSLPVLQHMTADIQDILFVCFYRNLSKTFYLLSVLRLLWFVLSVFVILCMRIVDSLFAFVI